MVVVEEVSDKQRGRQLRILGTGLAESKGLRHGYIVNKEEVSASIREAKRQAEAVARVPIRAGFLAVGGISLDEARASGFAIISRADQEITQLDIEKALASEPVEDIRQQRYRFAEPGIKLFQLVVGKA